jgi:uncharacterized RDD family membrane protein YckC
MKIKRVVAYLLDFFLVTFISTLIFYLPIFHKDFEEYNKYSQTEVDIVMGKDEKEYSEDELNTLEYNLNRSMLPVLIINLGMLNIYFGVLQYCFNGQTLGKKLMKIRVVSNEKKKINPSLFMLRSVLVSNSIPSLINILLLLFVSKETWVEYYSYCGLLQSTLTFLMLGFMLFRSDERGLHDLISNTKVIKKE